MNKKKNRIKSRLPFKEGNVLTTISGLWTIMKHGKDDQ